MAESPTRDVTRDIVIAAIQKSLPSGKAEYIGDWVAELYKKIYQAVKDAN